MAPAGVLAMRFNIIVLENGLLTKSRGAQKILLHRRLRDGGKGDGRRKNAFQSFVRQSD